MTDVQHYTQKSGLKTAYRWNGFSSENQPSIIFLPGYMSDMEGGKATAMFDHATAHGKGCLLLDYSGCGHSEGDFANGTLSLWCNEVCALIEAIVEGSIILVGSSMGGWLMLMIAAKLTQKYGTDKLHAMIGIAAAPDFTDWDFNVADKAIIESKTFLYRDNDYGYDPTPMYKKFFDDGQNNLFLNQAIELHCPVYLLHGQNDQDVPYDISMKLARQLCSSQVHIHLVKGGDHRFSRDQDIIMIIDILDKILG